MLIAIAVLLTSHQADAGDMQRLEEAYPQKSDRTETLAGSKGEIGIPYFPQPDDEIPTKPDEKGNGSKPTDEELCRRMCKLLKPSEVMPRCRPC